MHKHYAAPYSYLAASNGNQQREAFLRGEIAYPQFAYPAKFNRATLLRRKEKIDSELESADVPQEDRSHLEHCLVQTEFLLVSAELQHLNAAEALAVRPEYRAKTSRLYGEPHQECTESIYAILQQSATGDPYKRKLLAYITANTTFTGVSKVDIRPRPENFEHYRALFREYAPWLFDREAAPQTRDIKELLGFALSQVGADQQGWKVAVAPGVSNLHVSHRNKVVQVGEHFRVRSRKRRLQVVCHEVYGHVGRNLQRSKPFKNVVESEGFAVMLEQLLEPKFSTKRALRYFAIAAGWGVLGKPMDFRETFEIMWRAMVILSSYTETIAREKAFQECVRAFRGGRPDIAGAVFTKDTAYFEGNIAVWKQLEKRILSKEAFAALLTGRELLEV